MPRFLLLKWSSILRYRYVIKMSVFKNILSVYSKGTVQREFSSIFWHKWIGLGLNKNCFWLLNF
jgi:predicted DNA-binding transcriptional regulator